jgi:hypothetical protein
MTKVAKQFIMQHVSLLEYMDKRRIVETVLFREPNALVSNEKQNYVDLNLDMLSSETIEVIYGLMLSIKTKLNTSD